MLKLKDFSRVDDFEWEIPQTYRADMRVAVHIFASQQMMERGLKDHSFEQAINAATLPGLVGKIAVMPDVHQGYGFPIGGVAATLLPNGAISPGAIGYDINCGVRLLTSVIDFDQAKTYIEQLTNQLFSHCPSGVGVNGFNPLTRKDLDSVCHEGSRWAQKKGFATKEDLDLTEDNGCMEGADTRDISPRALERGLSQVGSLGSGNHFIEVDRVDKIFDETSAKLMGLQTNCICLMLHSGSRGLGHQICSDYVHDFQRVSQKYGFKLADRELVCAPLNSSEGHAYLSAMRCAANYAYCNRQMLDFAARQVFRSVFFGKIKNAELHLVYDLAHNIGKIENHEFTEKTEKVFVHRKGATRAFGPNADGIPERYREIGQPVLVPGSMGTSSWVMVGTTISMKKSIGSACHGAGRTLSRSQVKHQVNGGQLRSRLIQNGIYVKTGSLSGLAEEAPEAYKDVTEVVGVVEGAGLAHKVARLIPVAVIKG